METSFFILEMNMLSGSCRYIYNFKSSIPCAAILTMLLDFESFMVVISYKTILEYYEVQMQVFSWLDEMNLLYWFECVSQVSQYIQFVWFKSHWGSLLLHPTCHTIFMHALCLNIVKHVISFEIVKFLCKIFMSRIYYQIIIIAYMQFGWLRNGYSICCIVLLMFVTFCFPWMIFIPRDFFYLTKMS